MKTEAMDANALQKLEEEFDSEVRFRPLLPTTAWIVAGLLFTLSVFHYYTAGFGLLREATHRGIHMAFVLGLIFLVFGASKTRLATPAPASAMARPHSCRYRCGPRHRSAQLRS